MARRNATGYILDLLKCGSCRFAAFYFLSFQIGLLYAGRTGFGWVVFGFPFWFLHCLGVELLNRYSDRIEDRINRPERTLLCERIGFSRIRQIVIAIWSTLALVYSVWLLMQPSRILAALLWAGLAAGLCYSILVRFKTKRFLSLIALTFPVGGPFLIGWIAGNRDKSVPFLWHDILQLLPFLLMVGSFAVGHAGIKDITDIAGDKRIGYESFWVTLVRRRRVTFVLFSVSTWATLTVVFLVLGFLPTQFRYLLVLLPISFAIGLASTAASSIPERGAVRESLYYYWIGFVSFAMLLLVPTYNSGIRIALALFYWGVASSCLHWTDGLTSHKVKLSFLLGIVGGKKYWAFDSGKN